MTREQAARRVVKLRALAERPGSPGEGKAAAELADELVTRFDLGPDELETRERLDEYYAGPDYSARPKARGDRPRAAAGAVLVDHEEHPDRVHLAFDHMRSVCGVDPTFVWVRERDKLLTYDDPCLHCLATGMIDTRHPRRRLPGYPATP
jgi:hypothetical protein